MSSWPVLSVELLPCNVTASRSSLVLFYNCQHRHHKGKYKGQHSLNLQTMHLWLIALVLDLA